MTPGIVVILLALAMVCAAAYLPIVRNDPSAWRTIIKTVPVSLFAVTAFLVGAPLLLVAGLVLSALGDAFLSREGDGAFVAGLGAFLLAHVAYAALFFATGGGLAAVPAAAAVAILVFAFGFGALLASRAGPLAVPVAAYVLAIAIMGLGAAGIGGFVLAGALVFIASDAVLGAEKFLLSPKTQVFTAPAVWILYVAGQAMILRGVAF